MAEQLTVVATLRLGALALDLSLDTPARRIGLFGPSGSGKSTTLRILAGVERRAVGRVAFDGTVWQDGRRFVPPHERRVGWVPQDGCLFPHLSVCENLAYAGATDAEVRAMAERLRIADLVARRPRNLSGGERQRVALGRALLARPRLLLLDEPFAALDDALRAALAADLAELTAERSLPFVIVSHHAADAAALAEERWILANGALIRA
jgi:molybdate transport system ATP-binding protein